jgi:hypothetical protein
MHHKGFIADENTLGTSVEVNTVVQINAATQVNIGRLAQADLILYGREAVAVQNKLIGQSPQADTYQTWNPPQKKEQGLFHHVTT